MDADADADADSEARDCERDALPEMELLAERADDGEVETPSRERDTLPLKVRDALALALGDGDPLREALRERLPDAVGATLPLADALLENARVPLAEALDEAAVDGDTVREPDTVFEALALLLRDRVLVADADADTETLFVAEELRQIAEIRRTRLLPESPTRTSPEVESTVMPYNPRLKVSPENCAALAAPSAYPPLQPLPAKTDTILLTLSSLRTVQLRESAT